MYTFCNTARVGKILQWKEKGSKFLLKMPLKPLLSIIEGA